MLPFLYLYFHSPYFVLGTGETCHSIRRVEHGAGRTLERGAPEPGVARHLGLQGGEEQGRVVEVDTGQRPVLEARGHGGRQPKQLPGLGHHEGGDGGPGLKQVGVVAALPQLHQYIDHRQEVAAGQDLLSLGSRHEVIVKIPLSLAQWTLDQMFILLG